MPTFEITSPDGHVYHVDGPDGSTPDQALQMIQMQQSSKNTGIIGNIRNDFAKRDQEIQDSANAYAQGQQSMPETVLQNALSSGQKFTDVVNNGIIQPASSMLGPALQRVPGVQIAEKIASGIGNAVGSLPMINGQTMAQGAGQAEQQANQYLQNNPRLARNVQAAKEAIGLAATAAPVAKSLAAAIPAVGDALSVIKPGVSGPIPTSAAGFAEAGKAYDYLDKSGAMITADGVNNFLRNATQNIVTDPKLAGAIGKSEATKYLLNGGDSGEGLSSLANQPVTIQQIHAIDKDLSQQINKHFTDGLDSSGQQLMELQDTFRQHFMTPDASNITGGDGGFDAWQQANRLYSQSSKMKAVEDVIANAQNTQNPATAIQTGMRNILKSAKKTRGYSDDEIAALQNAAETGFAGDALKTFGGRLMTGLGTAAGAAIGSAGGPLGALAGGAIGGGTSFVGGRLLRSGAAALQEKGANNLLNVMGNGGLEFIPSAPLASSPAPKQLLLAAPDKMSGIPMTPEQIAISQAKMRAAAGATGGITKTVDNPGPAIVGNITPQNQRPLLPSPGTQYTTQMTPEQIVQSKVRLGQTGGVPVEPIQDSSGNVSQRVSPISNTQVAKLFGPEWDRVDDAIKDQITNQINNAWLTQKIPMADIIAQARQDAIDLSKATGNGLGTMAQALTDAQIYQLPAADALKYLKARGTK